MLKTLIVEDNPNDAELLIVALQRGGFTVEAKRVDDSVEFENALDHNQWDVIFSDHSMPAFSSFQALEIRNRKGIDTPFIILSGVMGEDMAVEAMKAGASDYFVKGKLNRLASAVKRELNEVKERESRKQAEWELGRFVASITHDLKTPLHAEFRVLQLLDSNKYGELTEEQHEMIQELIRSNQYAQHMVNNILFAYKYKENRVQLSLSEVDMIEFVDSLLNSISIRALLEEKSQELVLEFPECVSPIQIDATEMQRVLLNLVKNSIDYTPEKGTITVSMVQLDNKIRVSVTDTGSGVDPQVEQYLFSPYASAAKRYRKMGIGLGLYLSKQIIEAHQGTIGYQNMKPGSQFYFELPIEISMAAVHLEEAKRYQAV